jgi:hypothetical protein
MSLEHSHGYLFVYGLWHFFGITKAELSSDHRDYMACKVLRIYYLVIQTKSLSNTVLSYIVPTTMSFITLIFVCLVGFQDLFCWVFETGSYYVAQSVFEHIILLLQPVEC